MPRLTRLAVRIALALVLVACGKSGTERRERGEAGAPTKITSGTVPSEPADAGVAPPPENAPPPNEPVRMARFGAVVEDAGNDRGASVTRLTPGSQAASILRPGDIVTAVDLVRVRSASDLEHYLQTAKRGVVMLTVEREGTSRFVILNIG